MSDNSEYESNLIKTDEMKGWGGLQSSLRVHMNFSNIKAVSLVPQYDLQAGCVEESQLTH